MEFNDMRVKKLLTHSSCILYIGFFKNNDEEHFYSLSNNGQLKEWLLNPNGSVILLETCYLLRPGSEYLDYIGFPPTENSANGHNIIISSINVADNLLFCGYEDGLVLVWNQERRNVVDLNTIKSWKRSRTIVKQDKTLMEEMFGKGKDTSNEKGGVIMYNENDDDEENENDDNEENENNNNNESKSISEKSNEKNTKVNNKINNNVLDKIESTYMNKSLLYEGPTLSKKYLDFINIDNVVKAHNENLIREGKYRIDDITLFNLPDDIKYYKSSMVEEFMKTKDEVVIGEYDFKYKHKSYTNMFWLKYLFIHQKQEITYLFYYNYKDLHILLSSSKDGSICCYNIDTGELIYTFNISDYIKYACFCKEIPKSKRIIPKTHITLLCNSPRKIFLNLTKEKPINMNTYDFNYNDFTKIIYINNNFYLLGKRGNCIVFNNNFEDEKKVLYHKAIPLYDIIQFKKYFVIFTADFNMVLVDFNFDLSRMIELFYIKFGMNRVTNLIYINNILYITNADKNIYSIDVNTEYELYEERVEMIKEDKFCDAFNVFYELHKNKRKKKKKGKKGKGKKKSASPAKKKASPAKKKKK
jgi:WD40 repeat protein